MVYCDNCGIKLCRKGRCNYFDEDVGGCGGNDNCDCLEFKKKKFIKINLCEKCNKRIKYYKKIPKRLEELLLIEDI